MLLLILYGIRNDKAREVWKQWLNYFFCCHNCCHKSTHHIQASASNTDKLSTIKSAKKYTMATNTHAGETSFADELAKAVVQAKAMRSSGIQ